MSTPKKRKKKLLITVGAGASVEFGLPSTSYIDKILDDYAGGKYPLASDQTSNLYRYCRDKINHYYYSGSQKPGLRKCANFEEILYQLNLLAPYFSDPNGFHGSNALLAPNYLPEVLEFGRMQKPVDGNILRSMVNTLTDSLVDHFIDACERAKKTKQQEITELKEFLEALGQHFDIGVITLNYDNIFTQARPGLFTGFDPGTKKFNASSVFDRKDWEFIYHLHGSIHFAMTGDAHDMHRISWTSMPAKNSSAHPSGRNRQDSIEGTDYPTSTIVAGHGKTQQILRQPFLTYFAQINRLMHEADSLLCIGYGFSDFHLNAALSEVRNKKIPVAVIDWASDNADPLRFRCDESAYQMLKTLPTDPTCMGWKGGRAAAMVSELKEEKAMEISNDPDFPLAIWYNGFLEACRNPQKILEHLSSEWPAPSD